nr:quinol oxidase [Desulfobulbaceae bacterium]
MFVSFLPWHVIAAETMVEFAPGEEKLLIASVGEDGVQHVELIGGGYYFDPNHIVVKVDKPVELLVRKASGFVPHNIIVKAPEAGIDFNVNLEDKFLPINFTPTKTGKYTIYCDKSLLWFEDHQGKGMEGIIEVVE